MVVLKEVKSMFWALFLEAGKRYSQKVERPFHISMAALEIPTDQDSKSKHGGVVAVMVGMDKGEFLISSLNYKQLYQQPLDLNFYEGEEVTFFLNGDGNVHLTGYVMEDEPEMDSSMFDEEDMMEDSEEEDEEVPQLVSGKAAKRKMMKDFASAKSSKKPKWIEDEAEEADSDEDSDSDEDDDDDDDDDDDEDDLEFDEEGVSFGDVSFDEDDEEDDSDEEDDYVPPKKDKQTPKEDKKKKQQQQQEEQQQKSGKKDKHKNKQVAEVKSAPQTPSNQTGPEGDATESQKKKKKKKKNKNKEQDGESPQKQGQQTPAQNNKTPQAGKTPQQKGQTPKKQVLAGGTVMEEIRSGEGPVAKPGKMVHVYYVGKLQKNGQQFDSVTSGKPFRFRLGASEVIKGWDNGLAGMKVGGKRKLTIPPQQAYGNQKQGGIPANSTLVFEVELKNVS